MSDIYTPNTVKQFSERLNRILQSENRGQVLYRYRINIDEFTQLQKYLAGFAPFFHNPDLILKYSCPLDMYFVLYAAEWWRRSYEGEWSWKGILASIDLDSEAIGSQTLVNIVENGLKKWQRNILRGENGNRYALGSIAREGGLPIHYLTNGEGGWIERLLKPALHQKAATGDARPYIESHQDIIPKSYGRLQIIETFVELIDDIYRLIQKYKLDTQAKPIEYLNEKAPDWNELFPFPLETDSAQKMLRDLIVESVRQKRESNVSKIEAVVDSWQEDIQLKRIMTIDCTTSQVSLTASITAPMAIPLGIDNIDKIDDDTVSVDFNLQGEDTPQGHWTCYPVYNQRRLKLDNRKPIIVPHERWQDGIVMKIRNSVGQLIPGLVDSGNNSLNPYQNSTMYELDPTVPFMAQLINDDCSIHDSDIIKAEYVGSYSQQSKAECAVVYIPDNSDVKVIIGSELKELSTIFEGRLYLLTGSMVINCQDQNYRLKTNSQDVHYHYELNGRRLLDFDYPSTTIKGSFRIKQISKANSEDWSEVAKSRIRLAPLGLTNSNQVFKSLNSYKANELLGCFRLQILDDTQEAIVFQQTVGLVPEDFKYHLMPLQADTDGRLNGKICFATQQPIRLNVKNQNFTPSGVAVKETTSQDNNFILTTREVPLQKIALEMSFITSGSSAIAMRPLRFSCYFPSSKAVLYDNQGRVIDEGRNNFYHARPLNINSPLYGYRIKIFNSQLLGSKTALLEFSLRSDADSPIIKPISIGASRFLELEPYQWVDRLKSMMSFSRIGLDDEVCVKLYIEGSLKFELKFNYYDYELNRDQETQTLQLKTNSRLPYTENFDNPKLYDCYQNMQLRAINLRHPDHNAKSLDRTTDESDYGWVINNIKKEPGTWLLYSEPNPIIHAVSDENDSEAKYNTIPELSLIGNLTPQIRSTVWTIADKPKDELSYDKNSLVSDSLQLDIFASQPDLLVNNLDNAKPSLKKASSIANLEQRHNMIASVLSEMAFDSQHVGWSYMKHLTQACIDLPLVTLDNWQVAKNVPEFMCAVIMLGEELLSKDIVAKARHEIGFIWEFISFDDFTKIWDMCINLVNENDIDKKKSELEEISYVFTTFFTCLGLDSQPYNKQMVEIELKRHFTPLFNRKQEANERWPDSDYIQTIIENMHLNMDDNYKFFVNEISEHPYIQPILELPALLAWLSVYGNGTSNYAGTMSALKEKLLDKPLVIYNMKQFAPNWFQESYYLLVCWFNYCKSKEQA